MNILSLENITKSYGERKLFDQTSFFMQEGEKVGLIGINGTGKSTLLRIMAGIEETDDGNVTFANNMSVRFLPQQPVFEEDATVLSCVTDASHHQEESWEREVQAKSMLTKLGIYDFDSPVQVLSGGQKKRLALVRELLYPCDLLILDEPTNHLDHEMADWLELQLKEFKGSIIMVTHDRYFLDSVANRIVELDHGKLYSYETNYAGYLELKAERMAMAESTAAKRANLLRNELQWIRRGAQARSTKQKARIQRYEELKAMKGPARDQVVEMSSVSTRLGKTTVELEHISKAYGEKICIHDFSYIFLKDDRIGFVGKNGCGKTTLLKILNGKILPDEGKITIGQTVKIGYYVQEIEEDMNGKMDPKLRVIDYIRNTAEYVQTKEGPISASAMLERFLFAGEDQYGLIGKLSGGEKRRLNLLRVLMEAPNVLILDEPTNDLDIATLTILEDYLDHFQGIVIVVSHDRYFLDRTVRRIFAFEEQGNLKQYEGGYTDYRLRYDMEHGEYENTYEKKSLTSNEKAVKTWDKGRKKLKFTYMEQKEYQTIEADIAKLEEIIAQCDADMTLYARDFGKLNALQIKKDETAQLLEQKMDRWMYLEDLAARIEAGEYVD